MPNAMGAIAFVTTIAVIFLRRMETYVLATESCVKVMIVPVPPFWVHQSSDSVK